MKKAIVFVIVLVAIALAPILVKSYVDKNIQNKISVLDQRGVDLKILSEKGYFSSLRDFELRIKDVEKFAVYIGSISTNLNFFSSLMTSSEEVKKFLEEMVFKGNIENSNINYFANIKVNTYLDKVSDEFIRELRKDKTNPLYVALDKKLLNFDMEFSNKGIFKNSKLKDIDEKFNSQKGDTLDLKVFGQKLENNSDDKKIKIKTNLDEFLVDFENKKESFKFSFEDLDYDYSGESNLIADVSMDFKNILMDTGEVKFNIADIYSSSKGDLKKDKYDLTSTLKLSNFKGEDKISNIDSRMDSFKLDFDILGLDYTSVKEFMNYYNQSQAKALSIKDDAALFTEYMKQTQEMMRFLLVIVNKGFDIKINTNLDDLSYAKDSIKSLKIDLDANIKENKFDINKTHPLALLDSLAVKANVKIDEKGFETLSKFVPPLAMMLSSYAKKESDDIIFNIEFKNGNLSVNNQNLTLR